jgi:hypothetical protein
MEQSLEYLDCGCPPDVRVQPLDNSELSIASNFLDSQSRVPASKERRQDLDLVEPTSHRYANHQRSEQQLAVTPLRQGFLEPRYFSCGFSDWWRLRE